MYTLIKILKPQQFVLQQIPALTLALFIAELLYKFQSFTLECLAFLVTWFLFDSLIQIGVDFFRKSNKKHHSDAGKDVN